MSQPDAVTGYEMNLKFHWAVEPFGVRSDGFSEDQSTL